MAPSVSKSVARSSVVSSADISPSDPGLSSSLCGSVKVTVKFLDFFDFKLCSSNKGVYKTFFH